MCPYCDDTPHFLDATAVQEPSGLVLKLLGSLVVHCPETLVACEMLGAYRENSYRDFVSVSKQCFTRVRSSGRSNGQWSSLSEFGRAISAYCNSDKTSPESLLSPGVPINSDAHVYRNSGCGTDESLIKFAMTRYADRLTYNT